MRRRTYSTFVAFSIAEKERARLARLARRLGFSTLDTLGAEVFRIGLTALDETWRPLTRRERFLRARVTVGGAHDASQHAVKDADETDRTRHSGARI